MVTSPQRQHPGQILLQAPSLPQVSQHPLHNDQHRCPSLRGANNSVRVPRMVQARAGPGTGQPIVSAATLTAPPTTPDAEEVFDLSAWNQRYRRLPAHSASLGLLCAVSHNTARSYALHAPNACHIQAPFIRMLLYDAPGISTVHHACKLRPCYARMSFCSQLEA